MPPQADTTAELIVTRVRLDSASPFPEEAVRRADVVLLCLPADQGGYCSPCPDAEALASSPDACWYRLSRRVARALGAEAVLAIFDIPARIPLHQALLADLLHYQVDFAVRIVPGDKECFGKIKGTASSWRLPGGHAGLLISTRKPGKLPHADLRIAYEMCPVCGKTTKDYGGRRHLYPAFGTLTSDVWRDVVLPADAVFPEVLIARVAKLLSVAPRRSLLVLGVDREHPPVVDGDEMCWSAAFPDDRNSTMPHPVSACMTHKHDFPEGRLVCGDALSALEDIKPDSVDFIFADPPYNLAKAYSDYRDSLETRAYFSWCDDWLTRLERVLRPGRVLAVLNTPLGAMRHFLHLHRTLRLVNWIAWDALSRPARRIMPAHYGLILFEKNDSKAGASLPDGFFAPDSAAYPFVPPLEELLRPLPPEFCLRSTCRGRRAATEARYRGDLTDLWTDIHRLKHNTQRRDHPCQLPPRLLWRLIALYSRPGEVVLDPFNGIGTTTLCAAMMKRGFLGIERDEQYHALAVRRHEALQGGKDPFAKLPSGAVPAVKNNTTPRAKKSAGSVRKRELQLEIRRLTRELNRIPEREEVSRLGRYPLQLYDASFRSWSEAVASARAELTDGRLAKETALTSRETGNPPGR